MQIMAHSLLLMNHKQSSRYNN